MKRGYQWLLMWLKMQHDHCFAAIEDARASAVPALFNPKRIYCVVS